MKRFECPHLGATVELGDERERHIRLRHPELRAEFDLLLGDVLENPDSVRPSIRSGKAKLFSRLFPNLLGGKFVVVVVVSEEPDDRHWIVTAYVTRRITEGV